MGNALGCTRWDMSNVYSGLDAADYTADFDAARQAIAEYDALLDKHGVRAGTVAPGTDALVAAVEGVLTASNDLQMRVSTLRAFAFATFTTDSYDAAGAREVSRLEKLGVELERQSVRVRGWLGAVRDKLPEVYERSEIAREHRFQLDFMAEQSRYMMDETLEGLAAELNVAGATSFGKLQGTVTSQLKLTFTRRGVTEDLPLAVIRNCATDRDPEIRKAAYETELKGCRQLAPTVAACLNSVKQTARTLAERRGRDDVLHAALDQNRIDRATLDAMITAMRESVPMFRRYWASKAKKLGKDVLPWWDLLAPTGSSERSYTFLEARNFIVEKFRTFTPDLGDYAARAFDKKWIDAEPRDGKRGGAFCMGVPAKEESRILANYDGSFDQITTLAHELGHGFHNYCQTGLPILRRGAPMTLAETASIFCETFVAEAALKTASPADKLSILEAQLIGMGQQIVDILSRFIFESAVIEKVGERALSPDELCDLMRDAQSQTYGDAVDPSTYHTFAWLVKPHYYAAERNFYNFPYAFGLLFGLGLYAIYQREGEAFIPRYRELLRDTAGEFAAPLTKRFDIDITTPDFWRSSLAVIGKIIDQYEAL